jgi:hypothetical protein
MAPTTLTAINHNPSEVLPAAAIFFGCWPARSNAPVWRSICFIAFSSARYLTFRAIFASRRSCSIQMKKALLIFLFTISPAFADDQNVYDFFRQLPNSDSAIVDQQTTALIKRHMANLLYQVDMSSLARPETDAKFREQITALLAVACPTLTAARSNDRFIAPDLVMG